MALFTPEEIARNQALNERDRNYNQNNNIPAPPPPSAPSNSSSSSGGHYGMSPPPSVPSGSSGGGYTFDPNHVYNPSSPVPHPGMATPPIATPGGSSGPAVPYPGMTTPGSASSGGYSPPVPTPPQGQNGGVVVLPGGGVFIPGVGIVGGNMGQQPKPAAPVIPAPPPPRDMNAINQYAESQVGARLDAAGRARDLATGNLNTQAGQLTTQLNTQAEQQRTRLAATREQALKGLSTGYGQAQQGITDQRNLQNVDMQRQGLNPSYSGADAYKQAMLGREREITDKQNAQIYNNQVGSLEQDYQNNITGIEQDISNRTAKIQQDLQMNQANVQKAWQDVANAAPSERERLVKEATDQERSYQLALRNADRDDVLLELNKQKTVMEQARLDAENAHWTKDYALRLDDQKYNQQYKTDTLAETQKQNNVKNYNDLMNRYPLSPEVGAASDFNVLLDRFKGQVPAAKLAQLESQAKLTGTLPDELADLMGAPRGTKTADAQKFAADDAYRKGQQGIAQQNASNAAIRAGTAAKNAEANANKANQPKPQPAPNATQTARDTEAQFYSLSPDMRKRMLTDPQDSQELIRILGKQRFDALKKENGIQ